MLRGLAWEGIHRESIDKQASTPSTQTFRMPRTHRGEVEVDARDAAVGGGVALGLEGRVAHQELVQEHAQAPDVHHGVVRAALCFGRVSVCEWNGDAYAWSAR